MKCQNIRHNSRRTINLFDNRAKISLHLLLNKVLLGGAILWDLLQGAILISLSVLSVYKQPWEG